MPDINLDAVTLTPGPHRPGEGYCIEELVSVLAGEPWSDSPTCVSGLIAAYCRVLNDLLPDAPRQRLVRYAVRQIGTAGDDELEQRRAFLCIDYAVHRIAPTVLRAAGFRAKAGALEALPPVVEHASAAVAARVATRARAAAATARGACSDVDAAIYGAYNAVAYTVAAAAEPFADAAEVAVVDLAAAVAYKAAQAAVAAARALGGQWDIVFELLEALLALSNGNGYYRR
jgi:hypothetical protein